jgi:hypothetical protein
MLRISALMLAAFAIFDTGCGGGSSIDGTWVYSTKMDGLTVSGVLDFESDGSLTETATVSGCKGTMTTTGITWTSTATTLTGSGTPSCTGSLSCTIDGFTSDVSCADVKTMSLGGTCNYTMSNGDDTLNISGCDTGTAGDMTLTRQSS